MVDVGLKNESFRHHWIEKTLKNLPAGQRILDAGAGECPYKIHCAHLQYVSQDFAQYTGEGEVGLQMGSWDNSRIDIVSDITEIPVEAGSFDAVLCTEVLEHVPDPVRAIDELSRIIKPGGTLIITAPFASLTHFAPYHFCTGFNRYFYVHHLNRNGFDIEEMTGNGNYFEYIGQEIYRIKHVARKYTEKRVGFFEKVLMQGVLWTLKRLSRADHGSSELLVYGIHLVAKKR
jgi:ubiquinone/menaquinone biosynthesis C-methylase UbiE